MQKDDNIEEITEKDILQDGGTFVDIPTDVTIDAPTDEVTEEVNIEDDATIEEEPVVEEEVEVEEVKSKPKAKVGFFKGIKAFLGGIWKVIKTIFMGRILSVDFIIRYWKTILTALFVMLFYISNRYVCQQSAAHIKKLEREIVEIRYKSLDMFTRLKTLQREDSIVKYIDKYKLNLEFPTQPPYIIKAKADGEN